ncbi:hypothetical protein P5G51_019390 [Virgibacillus sp. 179-BFC.A HS]|uniref:Uncharacterized protein n=1 Tax=Tigheibacillus jepli TaxID=3035914 RepID=A0ABU5CLJ8_9BACI|nr:hypothetical protein [Virgibacillus sp. 179-BFC.A HS]MDY0407206.1 hypothetical protein [Virgibacillus sp. 179-BFC.A HS]
MQKEKAGEVLKTINKNEKKTIKLFQKLKQNRKVKKEFQKKMKELEKKPNMLKQTSDILPFVQIHDDYILLKEGVMDIFQVQTKNIHALNDADLNYLLLNRAQFLRSYFRSFKEVILNFPTNTEVQRAYWLKKQRQAKTPARLKYIEQKLFEFEYLERKRYNREFFMFIYAADKEELEDRKHDCMQGMQSSFPLQKLPKNKKEQVLFLLNNQNTQL